MTERTNATIWKMPRFHDGTITVRSKTTGRHRTFRIETRRGANDPMRGNVTIGLLTGPANTDDFTDFGFVNNGTGDRTPSIVLWKTHRSRSDGGGSFFMGTPYLRAMARVAETVDRGQEPTDHEKYCALLADGLSPAPSKWAVENYEFMESRTCRRCGRELTTPESIEAGIGPECAEREKGKN